MAHQKNTNRHKRKYNDARVAATERNRARKKQRDQDRTLRLMGRTVDLIGKTVTIRTAKGPVTGPVKEVVEAPEGAARKNGQYLVVHDAEGPHVRSRHRAKVAA